MAGLLRDPLAPRRRSPALAVGLIALATLVGLAMLVPALRPPADQVQVDRGLAANGAPLPPSLAAPLGTDDLGRDVAARVFTGLRTSLATAALATALALGLGLAMGVSAGLARARSSWLDAVLTRITDVVQALPVLLLAILAAAAVRAAAGNAPPSALPSAGVVALALGLLGWPPVARVARARTLSLARSDLVLAARALGGSPLGVLWRHILPNTRAVMTVLATVILAQTLLADATLSFLGLGVPPPAATLGRMVYDGRVYYRTAPWLLLAPGAAIAAAVATCYVLAAGLRRRYQGDV